MPVRVKFETPHQNSPLAAIIQDASLRSAGVMTPAQVAALAAASVGESVALDYQAGWGNGAAPQPVGQSRLYGDEVEFLGLMDAPAAGVAPGAYAAQLPEAQWPATIQLLGCIYVYAGTTMGTTYLIVDDNVGTYSGHPGAIVVGTAIPNSGGPEGASLLIQGLRFLRT